MTPSSCNIVSWFSRTLFHLRGRRFVRFVSGIWFLGLPLVSSEGRVGLWFLVGGVLGLQHMAQEGGENLTHLVEDRPHGRDA